MGKALSLIFIILFLPQISAAGDWRGIVPLRSTRADVERLLGQAEQGSRNVYRTSDEKVVVTYSQIPCDYGWQVRLDTVISVSVYPKTLPKLVDLKLVESKYQKRKDPHLEATYYYVNEAEGLNYTVHVGRGEVNAIEYYASAKDKRLQCPQLKGTASPKERSALDAYLAGYRVQKENAGNRPAPPRSIAGLSTAERVREMERLAPTYEFACPMHSDVRQTQEGECPKCGMMLTTVKPSVLGEYKLAVTTRPLKPKVGEKTVLRFVISNPKTGAPVRKYVVNHEKLFHLFIVSQDLAEYQHIHPQLRRDGSFEVETVLPRAGLYKLHADFFPAGGTTQVIHRELSTANYSVSKPAVPALVADEKLVKTVAGMSISLELTGTPVAGALVPLKYRLTDEKTGEPVRDLEPYLGAWGHTLMLNADQSEYLHSHPTQMLPLDGNLAALRGGPEVEFKTMFPAGGNYRIWTQFQRAGKVITVFFTVKVVD